MRVSTRSGAQVDCVWNWIFFCSSCSLVPKAFGSDCTFVVDPNLCKALLFSSWGFVIKTNNMLYLCYEWEQRGYWSSRCLSYSWNWAQAVSSKALYCPRQEVFNVILGSSYKMLFVQRIFGIALDSSWNKTIPMPRKWVRLRCHVGHLTRWPDSFRYSTHKGCNV